MKFGVVVSHNGHLVPDDDESREWIESKPFGTYLEVEVTSPRNAQFHRKYMKLLRIAFEYWNESGVTNVFAGLQIQKNFDRFRKDIVIACGFFHYELTIDGNVDQAADSISFAGMDHEKFENLYSKTIDVLLAWVYSNTITEDQLRSRVDELLRFS